MTPKSELKLFIARIFGIFFITMGVVSFILVGSAFWGVIFLLLGIFLWWTKSI
jgi:hypothetical protein